MENLTLKGRIESKKQSIPDRLVQMFCRTSFVREYEKASRINRYKTHEVVESHRRHRTEGIQRKEEQQL